MSVMKPMRSGPVPCADTADMAHKLAAATAKVKGLKVIYYSSRKNIH